jgi:hypothetical protein
MSEVFLMSLALVAGLMASIFGGFGMLGCFLAEKRVDHSTLAFAALLFLLGTTTSITAAWWWLGGGA